MEIICRICRIKHCKKIIPLLKIVPNSNELEIEGEKFEYCLGLKILEIPNYPGICTVCEQQLNEFYAFKQQAINSHYELLEVTQTQMSKITNNIQLKIKSDIFDDIDDFENDENENDFVVLDTMNKTYSESDDDFLNSLCVDRETDNEFAKIGNIKVEETDHISLEMLVDECDDLNNVENKKSENFKSKNNVISDTKKYSEIETNIKSEKIDRTPSPEIFNDGFDLVGNSDDDDDGFNAKIKSPQFNGEIIDVQKELNFTGKLPATHTDNDFKETPSSELTNKKKKKSKRTHKDVGSEPGTSKKVKMKKSEKSEESTNKL